MGYNIEGVWIPAFIVNRALFGMKNQDDKAIKSAIREAYVFGYSKAKKLNQSDEVRE